MWEEIIKQAAANGLWALMFCVLLVHQLKESRSREEKYQATVRSLAESLTVVKKIGTDLEEVKAVIKNTASFQGCEKIPASRAVRKVKPKAKEVVGVVERKVGMRG